MLPTESIESVKTTEELSHQRMTNANLPKKREDAPYYLFGKKFSDRKRALALSKEYSHDRKFRSNSEAAKFLNMDRTKLFLIEEGHILPNREDLPKIAEYLKKKPENVQFWYDSAIETYEKHLIDQPIEHGALRYSKFWDIQENDFKLWYCQENDVDKIPPPVLKALKRFREKATRIFTLDLMPMSTFLIVSEVLGAGDNVTYLNDIKDVIIVGESLALLIARDPYLGPYTLYAANQLFFRKDPKKNIEDCVNCLTVDQFRIILHVALENSDIYGFGEDLSTLQSIHEFSSHGVLMARGLKKALKEEFPVDYHRLTMGLALQNLGVHAFYSILKPSLTKHVAVPVRGYEKEKDFKILNDDLYEKFNWEFHAPISGGMAANWGFDEEVVHLVIDHHAQPISNVTPTCAMLKFINICTNKNFNFRDRQELENELKNYPQFSLPAETVFQLLLDLKQLVDQAVLKSSSVVTSRASQVSELTQTYAKGYRSNVSTAKPGEFVSYSSSAGVELRLTTDYQKALINDCYRLIKRFNARMLSKRKNESLDNFGKRMQHLELAKHLLKHNLIDATAHEFGLKPEEIEAKLMNLGN